MAKQTINTGESGTTFVEKLRNNFTELYGSIDGSQNVGYIIQEGDDISSESWWETAALTRNLFVINIDHDFGGSTVNLPDDTVLLFNGGVWSNGTISGNNCKFVSYGIRQCFEPDLILTGLWVCPYITPQHYGATSNLNKTTYSNDSSAAIQACLSSAFDVFIPVGFYYLSTALICSVKKTIHCSLGEDNDSVIFDHSRFYTDQNIDLLEVRCEINWSGGIFDVSAIAAYTHSVVIFNINYPINGGNLKLKVLGSRTGLIASTNTGRGIYINYDANTTDTGYLHNLNVDIHVSSLYYGLYFPVKGDATKATWANTIGLKVSTFGCKQPIKINADVWYINLIGIYQSDTILTLEEADLLPVVELGCGNSVIDVILSDYDDRTSGGYYVNHTNYIVNDGIRNRFINNSTSEFYYGHIKGRLNSPGTPVIMKAADHMIISGKNHSSVSPIISYLHNALAYSDKRDSGFGIAAYDGTDYNYDTNLDESSALDPATAITLYNTSTLTALRGGATSFIFTDNVAKDNEFIEIVFSKSASWARFFIAFAGSDSFCNRLQAIMVLSGSTLVKNEYPPVPTSSFYKIWEPFSTQELYTANPVKIIIRLIGASAINEAITIADVYASTETNLTPSVIDIGGGQTIYGNLSFSGGIPKLLSQATYADNTAAKAGGLVAGDTYRTSTGVLMVVYD